jgi:hypothetical protein
LYSTGSGGGTTTFPAGRTGFVLFAAARLTTLFAGRAERFAAALRNDVRRRAAVLAVLVALIAFALAGLLCHHCPGSSVCFVFTALQLS